MSTSTRTLQGIFKEVYGDSLTSIFADYYLKYSIRDSILLEVYNNGRI